MEGECVLTAETDGITEPQKQKALDWLMRKSGSGSVSCGAGLVFPSTGTVIKENGEEVCMMFLYLFQEIRAGFLGFCITRPGLKKRTAYRAVTMALAVTEQAAKERNLFYLFGAFGNRGLNRLLKRSGYHPGDKNAEHWLKVL